MEKKQIRVTESERRPLSDALNSFTTGFLVISPVVETVFNRSSHASYWEAFKKNFTTHEGWKINLISGAFIAVFSTAFYAMMGKYNQKTHTLIVEVPDGTVLPGEIKTETPVTAKFQEKEIARREEAAEHEAQIG